MCTDEWNVIDDADLTAVSGGAIIGNAMRSGGFTKSLAGGTWNGQSALHANGTILEPLARPNPANLGQLSGANLQQMLILNWLMGR